MSAQKKEKTQSPFSPLFLEKSEYSYFSKKIYNLAGINLPLNEKNISLLQNRLSRLLRKYNLNSYQNIISKLETNEKIFIEDFISCLTTNKTHFFREPAHFDFLKKELSTHFYHNSDLRIWCAASSTGQEPYTLSMVLHESLTIQQLSRSRILATDIDLEILNKASLGLFDQNELEGLNNYYKNKYFTQDISTKKFKATPQLQSIVDFNRFNLVTGLYKFSKNFDFIFCRNVLIYFDPPTTHKVIDSLGSVLKPGGYLILGHSESGSQQHKSLKSITQAVFKKENDNEKN